MSTLYTREGGTWGAYGGGGAGTPGLTWSANGLPPQDGSTLLFGAASGSNTTASISTIESKIGMAGAQQYGLHRMFWSSGAYTSGMGGDIETRCAASHTAGRIPWISIKLPGNAGDWASAAAGNFDADFTALAADLGALSGPVWVAIHHEPEGDGVNADWVAMQRRLLPLFDGYSNIATTTIVTGYNQTYGYAGQSWDTFWTGGSGGYVPDIFGWDPYNFYKTYWNATTWGWVELGVTVNPYSANTLTSLHNWIDSQPDTSTMRTAIAETGYSDACALTGADFFDPELGYTVGTQGPGSEWMQRQVAKIRATSQFHRMAAVTYFDLNTVEINNQPHKDDVLAAATSCSLYPF